MVGPRGFLVTYLAAVALHVVVAVVGLVVLIGFIVAARRGQGLLARR